MGSCGRLRGGGTEFLAGGEAGEAYCLRGANAVRYIGTIPHAGSVFDTTHGSDNKPFSIAAITA